MTRAELGSLAEVLGTLRCRARHRSRSGSVKSNIGHLKAAAGAAGLFKTVMALHEKVLVAEPELPGPQPQRRLGRDRRFGSTPSCATGRRSPDGVRRAGVSAFGFGGTNFHAVLEEYVPGRHRDETAPRTFASAEVPHARPTP